MAVLSHALHSLRTGLVWHQVQETRQFNCGMWLLLHQLSLHSLGTKMSFRLLHSPLKASFSFPAHMTKQFECGMQQLAPQSVNLFEAIQITSIALHSPAMARSSHRARMT